MYAFLLGRDSKLSKLELTICFNEKNIDYSVILEKDNFLILDIDKNEKEILKITEKLSGIIRISKIYLKTNVINENVINNLNILYPSKFNYAISYININEQELDNIEVLFKKLFKSEKVKAVYKKPVTNNKKQSQLKDIRTKISNPDNFYSWKIENGFELFVIKEKEYFFSTTIFCSYPKEFAIKDKRRPVIKEKHNTSFRLASIMVNLLGLKENKTIVDPFCGTGTFLIEGLIKGYNVIGIDNNKEMVYASNKNLDWAKSYFKIKKEFKVIEGDSSKVKFVADACVFEPYMGDFIKRLPSADRAKKTVNELNKLYFDIFKNLNKCLKSKSKVVCIFPEFKTYDNQVFKIKKSVFLDNGFRYVDVEKYNSKISIENPIMYSTPSGSVINRSINILEKTN